MAKQVTRKEADPAVGIREDDDPLLNSAQVARLFYVARSTAWRWAAEGRIPSVQTPGGPRRVRLSDVQAILGQLARESR
jgi:excisionase family DNA binding protein